MKYCQGPKCHEYKTKDRIKGTKGSKSYQTRRRSHFYYGQGNFCSLNCQTDWLTRNIEQALNHFGRTTEAKKVLCNNAWFKDYQWQISGSHDHYFRNDLLGQRIAITEAQYNDEHFTHPNGSLHTE